MSCFVCVACFHALYTRHIAEKCIGSSNCKTSFGINTAERTFLCADQCPECRIFQRICSNFGKIRGSGVMIQPFVQSVRCGKMCIGTAYLCSFLVHKIHKFGSGSTYVFCNGYCSIIVRRYHQRIKKMSHIKSLAGFGIQFRRFHRCGIRGKFNHIVEIAVFQSQNTGHDLRSACHGAFYISILFKQYSSTVTIQQYRISRMKSCKHILFLFLRF